MTEDEWVQQAMATMPAMSESKRHRLALIFREEENGPDYR
jgi:hypothetical protein